MHDSGFNFALPRPRALVALACVAALTFWPGCSSTQNKQPATTETRSMSNPQFSLAMVKIPVKDVAASAPFYRNLGFQEQFVVAQYGWAQFDADGLPLALYVPGMGGGQRSTGGTVDFHIAVADLTAYDSALREKGVQTLEGVVRSDDGGAFLEVKDPDGNVLKFVQGSQSE